MSAAQGGSCPMARGWARRDALPAANGRRIIRHAGETATTGLQLNMNRRPEAASVHPSAPLHQKNRYSRTLTPGTGVETS